MNKEINAYKIKIGDQIIYGLKKEDFDDALKGIKIKQEYDNFQNKEKSISDIEIAKPLKW